LYPHKRNLFFFRVGFVGWLVGWLVRGGSSSKREREKKKQRSDDDDDDDDEFLDDFTKEPRCGKRR